MTLFTDAVGALAASALVGDNLKVQIVGTAGRCAMGLSVAWKMAVLMCAASVLAYASRPSESATELGSNIRLEEAVPRRFGQWTEDTKPVIQLVDPQQRELIGRLYSQTLARSYINAAGYRIMLSLAYGDDQRGGLQAHRPELCYPAQGFAVLSSGPSEVRTSLGRIPVHRLNTRLGSRVEPVTYWFAVADRVVSSRFEHRLAEVRIGLTGQLPYGLLFRVSSVDEDTERAYREQERFVDALLQSVSAEDLVRLSGLSPPP